MANMEQVAGAYIKLRDAKKAMKDRHSEEMAPIEAAMKKIEAWCLNDLQNVRHAQSEKTKAGTVYLTTLLKPKVEDADVFLTYLKDNNLLHMLNVSPTVPAMEEYLEANGHPPPGTSIRRETFARIRK